MASIAADLIRGMSSEEKEEVFLALLKEAIQESGDSGLMHVEDKEGHSLGYYVPPKVAAEHLRRLAPVLTAEQRAVTLKALSSLDKTFEMKEYLNELALEDAREG